MNPSSTATLPTPAACHRRPSHRQATPPPPSASPHRIAPRPLLCFPVPPQQHHLHREAEDVAAFAAFGRLLPLFLATSRRTTASTVFAALPRTPAAPPPSLETAESPPTSSPRGAPPPPSARAPSAASFAVVPLGELRRLPLRLLRSFSPLPSRPLARRAGAAIAIVVVVLPASRVVPSFRKIAVTRIGVQKIKVKKQDLGQEEDPYDYYYDDPDNLENP
ncbi:uncharacterized protein LOC127777386 [Oryza glaberrima]|uniref:uncharacterized protein LOC127777386 n=1 Tax=Oryza glaberrima TaxID=4538 RepID=UPI00224BF9BF|nr:uncharacterized protein LOC127777386 [Oryza glaberrima]